MAKAFPYLQNLDLGTSVGSNGRTNVTLAGLVPLVQNCPDLHHLGIVVQPPNGYCPDIELGRGFSNFNVKTISVGDSRITDPATVASFLCDIFPELDTIVTNHHDDNTITAAEKEMYKKLWGTAADLVASFTAAIRQGRSLNEDSDRRSSND